MSRCVLGGGLGLWACCWWWCCLLWRQSVKSVVGLVVVFVVACSLGSSSSGGLGSLQTGGVVVDDVVVVVKADGGGDVASSTIIKPPPCSKLPIDMSHVELGGDSLGSGYQATVARASLKNVPIAVKYVRWEKVVQQHDDDDDDDDNTCDDSFHHHRRRRRIDEVEHNADRVKKLKHEIDMHCLVADHPNVLRFLGPGNYQDGSWFQPEDDDANEDAYSEHDMSRAPSYPVFLAMELADGRSLKELVHARGVRAASQQRQQQQQHTENSFPPPNAAVPLALALPLARDMAQSLAHLHASEPHPIVHRDVRLSNFLVVRGAGKGGRPAAKLADFGRATLLANRTSRLRCEAPSSSSEKSEYPCHSLEETRGYIAALGVAPEVTRGESYGISADVFSLGASLFHLLTGIPHCVADDDSSYDATYYAFPLKELRKLVPTPRVVVMEGKHVSRSEIERFLRLAHKGAKQEILERLVDDVLLACLRAEIDRRPSAEDLVRVLDELLLLLV